MDQLVDRGDFLKVLDLLHQDQLVGQVVNQDTLMIDLLLVLHLTMDPVNKTVVVPHLDQPVYKMNINHPDHKVVCHPVSSLKVGFPADQVLEDLKEVIKVPLNHRLEV